MAIFLRHVALSTMLMQGRGYSKEKADVSLASVRVMLVLIVEGVRNALSARGIIILAFVIRGLVTVMGRLMV